MIQIWILHRTINPLEAIRTGADAEICGDCVHRGNRETGTKRRCYVQVDKAPNGIWKAYRRGVYRVVDTSEYGALFGGRKVRFGAYGDPAYIPLWIIEQIVKVCLGHTGYTHQWRNPDVQAYRAYIMASADSPRDARDAVADGWRYFRVRPIGSVLLAGEIMCPASEEAGKRTVCADCGLCNGTKHGARDMRKNIAIIDHSRIAASQPLIQLQ